MHEQGAWRVNQRNITCGHSNQVSVNVSGFLSPYAMHKVVRDAAIGWWTSFARMT